MKVSKKSLGRFLKKNQTSALLYFTLSIFQCFQWTSILKKSPDLNQTTSTPSLSHNHTTSSPKSACKITTLFYYKKIKIWIFLLFNSYVKECKNLFAFWKLFSLSGCKNTTNNKYKPNFYSCFFVFLKINNAMIWLCEYSISKKFNFNINLAFENIPK